MLLHQALKEEIGKKAISKIAIPLSITQNLNPKYDIRPYQVEAFQYFLAYMEEDHNLRKNPAHLLFQMATGSGKTIMMAGLILYLYEKGYRNFLFFVNSTTIIDKTKDNFLNVASSKYLFAPQIKIGEKLINIVQAENFEGETGEDICIVFDTIQGLHSKLANPRENSLTMSDFEELKLVMIADEAHHLSAETKKGQTINMLDEDVLSWEGAVLKILHSNEQNLLLDFTATAELRNDYVADKYKDKLIFDYPLKAFRRDGYSKEVEIFKSDSDLMQRALQAVILSHYRKKLFAEMGFHIKPVILFKSKNIDPSKEFMQTFIEEIENLQVSDIEIIQQTNREGVLAAAFQYFVEKKLDLMDLILELKTDFSKERCISANDDKEKAKLQIQLNTLEAIDNPVRAVFAVDKLNEGWDVLNLFDIVRLYETRDAGKSGKIGKSTASEAQLIGRGARYCPFAYSDIPNDKRKFDRDTSNKYRICETMYYHSNNDSRYIYEITQALQLTGLFEKNTKQVRLKLKESFENSDIYQKGFIFLNEQIEIPVPSIDFGSTVRQKIYNVDLFSGKTTTSRVFTSEGEEISQDNANISKSVKEMRMIDLGKNVIRKALHQIKNFEFNVLQKKFKELKGLNEFITSKDYLANIVIHLTGGEEQLANIKQADKLWVARSVLQNLDIINLSENRKFEGTKTFKALSLKSVIKEKVVTYTINNAEEGRPMTDHLSKYVDRDIVNANWYAFTDCYGTSEEKALVTFMKAKYNSLKEEYEEFYLVRNERHFAIYEYDEGRKFEPDFVLFLKKKKDTKILHYQIFIEPKGEHLEKEDKWKESFLIRLHNEASIQKNSLRNIADENAVLQKFWSNDEFTVWGLPFYNENAQNKKIEFSNALDKIVNME